jgi:DNA-binding Lrp family transcriptional regulator
MDIKIAVGNDPKNSHIYQLDDTDKRLLQLLQENFPLVECPWSELGSKMGLSEEQVIGRVENLCAANVIRKIGAIVDNSKIGYTSATLVALRVPESKVNAVASVINRYGNISHNYERDCEYNVWFTLVAKSGQELTCVIDEILQEAGLSQNDVLSLPTVQRFKINVNFRLV